MLQGSMGTIGNEEGYNPLPGYDWPCRGITPAQKQQLTSAFLVWNPRSFCLNDPGTGKSLAALWAADFLMSQYERFEVRCLILAPLSTLDRVWKKEIKTHFFGKRVAVVVHGTKQQRLKALNTRADFYIMNFDGVKVPEVFNKLLIMDKIKIGLTDESTAFKNSSSKRTKKAKIIMRSRPYCWMMTGTPTPQGPEDAHGQAAVCHPLYQETKTAFRARIMMQVGMHKFIAREDSYDQARAILQPSIRLPRRAFHDLPPSIPVPYKVPFSEEQTLFYNQLKKEFKAVLAMNKGEITATHEGALRLKLLQIAAGAVYDAEKNVHYIDATPRIAKLREIIHECTDKLLIFASFTSVLTLLHNTFMKEVECAAVSGKTPRRLREKAFSDFQDHDDGLKVIFADPRTMAHGLTLTKGTHTVWYGPIDSNEVYTQANYRVDRPGKTKDTYAVQIGSSPVEWEIFARLESRQNMQGAMLKIMEGWDD
jgi:SNF2 family DNA or RNA helicase